MSNRSNEKRVVPSEFVEKPSRRRVLAIAATVGIGGGVGGLVGARQEAHEIELEGEMGGWVGIAPAGIDGQTNPTLSLVPGEDYAVRWTNADGQPHNFVVEDGDGNELVRSDVISDGSQTVEFTATEEMAEYYCEVHPQSMRGDVQLADDESPEGEETDASEDGEGNGEPPEDGEASQDDESPEDEGADGEPPEDEESEEPEVELPREYHAHLEGEPHGIETDASGEARFQVDEDGRRADYEVMVENICNVTQAHVHLGAEGEDGPVVVWLYPEERMEPELVEGRFTGALAEGTITADDFVGEWEGADFEDAVSTFEEEGAYVNVHTEEHPGGEIRGQILPPHE